MKTELRRRFWVQGALAATSAVLAALTALWRDWIEVVFRVDPDHSSGALEWLTVAAFVTAATLFTVLARSELRRVRPAV
jgi:hypothetical protein